MEELVFDKRTLTHERHATLVAHVRPLTGELSGVIAYMSGEVATVTEGGTALFAHERLLACVRADVLGETVPRIKLSPASITPVYL